MTTILNTLQHLLDEAVAASGVPAASVAVHHAGKIHVAASGMANVLTGVSATTDTVFQIGSITKAFTASLAMQLVESGQLKLEDRLAQHLPELALCSTESGRQVTIHQLLCHTSGIDGDQLIDSGRGDDYLEKFIAQCDEAEFIHPPGAFFSYCNAGYILLGRIIEKLTGQCFDDVLKQRLSLPLGLEHAGTLADELALQRFAPGHSRNDAGGYDLEPLWFRSNTPSGARTYMTASELVTFAHLHLSGGVTAQGERILSAESVARMQSRAVEIPLSHRYTGWGLGWMHFDWGGQRVFGHDGGVAGTSSFLRIVPERNLAIALMTNGAEYPALLKRVFGDLLRELAGIDGLPTVLPALLPPPVDVSLYTGLYGRHGLSLELCMEGDRLIGKAGGEYQDPDPPAMEIQCIDRERFRARLPGTELDIGLYFLDFDSSGRPGYLHYMERAFRKAAP